MAQVITKGGTYTVGTIRTGVSSNNRKWQLVIPQETDRISLFIDNDIELSEGDVFVVRSFSKVSFRVAKNGDKYYHNYSANVEIEKNSVGGIDELDDIDNVDLDKVIV